MIFNRVKDGDIWRPPAAATWNAVLDVAEAGRLSVGGQANVPLSSRHNSNETVLVKNTSGSLVPRFGVLGVESVLIEPAANLPEFQNRIALLGTTPVAADHASRFAITLEPIPAGKIGRASITGIARVKVDKQADDERTAGVVDGEVGYLSGGGDGVEILYSEAGTGVKWAVAKFGAPRPITAIVTLVDTDHITVKRIDPVTGDATDAPEFRAAKPWKLRQDVAQYTRISSMDSVSGNSVTVNTGLDNEESWGVEPPYNVGDYVVVAPISYTGVETGSGGPVKWIDTNVDARRWAEDTSG